MKQSGRCLPAIAFLNAEGAAHAKMAKHGQAVFEVKQEIFGPAGDGNYGLTFNARGKALWKRKAQIWPPKLSACDC